MLPSGARVPNNVPGKNLRDKIEGCYRRSAGQPATSPIHMSKGTDTPSTCTPSSGLAAFDLDQKIYLLEQEVQKLDSRKFAKNAPSHVSTSAPYEPPPRIHMPYAPAPVAIFQASITPWSAPTESSTTPTPVKFARASRNFKPINYPERLPTPPATIRPPPYSKPSTPRQPITIQALLIESARPVGRCTTVPTTTALPPTEPSPPFSPASLSPAVRSNPTPVKLTSSPPSFGHPGLRVPVAAPSFEHTPVSSLPSIPVSPLFVPAVSSKKNGRQPTLSCHTTTPAPDVSAGEPCRLPPVESLATVVAPANPVTPKTVAHAASHSTTTTPPPTFEEPTMPTPVPASPASITTPVPTPAADHATAATSTATIEHFTPAPFRAHRPATAAVPTTRTFEEPATTPATTPAPVFAAKTAATAALSITAHSPAESTGPVPSKTTVHAVRLTEKSARRTSASTAPTTPAPPMFKEPAMPKPILAAGTTSITTSASIPAAAIMPARSTSKNHAVAPSPAPSCAAGNISSRCVDLVLPSRIPRLKSMSAQPFGTACISTISANRIFGVAALPR
ncbi:hypothetical protein H0H81_004561 [Sphagnurus paluster]|uniref:Uncharacterized protein n=1 Tax=Sphagnurus paluster TaxID=117069 RepID=A0A9P7FLJ7_9AGAR|nr:hypothetical protein H0H81_004561 [Sphagnurus paluster]